MADSDTPNRDPDRPQRVGPFHLGGSLGSGAMGEVYLARDERLGRWVALKRIQPGHHSAESLARFRREARIIAKLRHRSIVQIHDLLETEDGDWLVMERLDGESLADRLAAGAVEPLEAVDIARRIAEGLAEAHAQGVVHRDLKASNIMLTRSGVKILDFGLAKTQTARDPDETGVTGEGQLIGTVGAMAPEQARGLDVDERADLFALGMLLYRMLAGVAPFDRRTALATLNAICDAPAEPLAEHVPGAPKELTDLVHQLLAKRADERPAGGAQETVERLRRLRTDLGGDPGSLSSASLAPPTTTPFRRFGLVAAGLLIAAAALGSLMITRSAEPDTVDDEPLRLLVSPFFYSGLEDRRFFAQGLGEEIRARLSTLDDVLVISRLARGADGPEDGPGPPVDYRLDGAVVWPGDGGPVTVTLRLTAENGGDAPWEHTFEEPPTDVLALQAKLAGDVALQLPIRVGDL
ncbi:MAG: serine/threonine-protein kinase, partial [Acidobacteriota bacterium]